MLFPPVRVPMSDLSILGPSPDVIKVAAVMSGFQSGIDIVITLSVEERHRGDIRLAHKCLSDNV